MNQREMLLIIHQYCRNWVRESQGHSVMPEDMYRHVLLAIGNLALALANGRTDINFGSGDFE
jgi:hypothetical protein